MATEKIEGNLIEQKITKQVTIVAGSSTTIQIPIAKTGIAYLKGYGYTWFASNTYQLSTGNTTFPARSDQEGSPAIPMIYGRPFNIRSSGNLELKITNGDSTDHTYDVVFYILTNEYIETTNTGGAISLDVSTAAGTGTISAIADSSFTNVAPCSATKGLSVTSEAPATLIDGSKSAVAAAAALSTTTALKKGVMIQPNPSGDTGVYVGNATSQNVFVAAGDMYFIPIDDLVKVYVMRAGSADIDVYYNAS